MLGYATSLPSLKETDLSHDAMATQCLENYCYNFIIKSNTLIDSDKIIIIWFGYAYFVLRKIVADTIKFQSSFEYMWPSNSFKESKNC